MKFFSIPNQLSSIVTVLDKPWEIKPKVRPPYEGGKPAMAVFANSLKTEHNYISIYEGMTETVRVAEGTGNVPFRMHGFIADYDGKLPPDPVQYLLEKAPSEFLPNWVVRTASDQGRLVWDIEHPLMTAGGSEIKEFLRVVARQMTLAKWLGQFDDAAWSSPHQYFELGQEWLPVKQDACIPSAMVEMWLLMAAKDIKYDTQSKFEYTIPIEEIATAVRERFPGRWKGEFMVGSRGVRFWDPTADNPTGALIREDGVRCFTGGQPFVSWRQIFGQGFVEKYEASHIAGVVQNAVWDGRGFWMKNEAGIWEDWPQAQFRQDLVVRGYSSARKRGDASEIDIIENTLVNTRKVKAALPFLYFPPGPIKHDGKLYLNISRVRCMPPGPPFGCCDEFISGRTAYPFVYELLKTLLGSEIANEKQLPAFLAWLKYFYVNSLEGNPRPGHAIVLAGLHGQGKTLLVRKIVGDLMTGHSEDTGSRVKDASDHLVSGSKWTERLADSPIMRIDDSFASSDLRGHRQFTERIKRYVSTNEMLCEEKYAKAGTVPWFGRIMITCNTDSESMEIMPSMDMSTADKICLFRTSERRMIIPEWAEIDKICVRELPNFARFLVDWNIPEDLRAYEKRFGVASYHHPDLLAEARDRGVGELLDVLIPFLAEYRKQKPESVYWEGSGTQLYTDLSLFNAAGMRSGTAKSVSTRLGYMLKHDMNVSKHKSGVQTIWRVGYNLTAGDARGDKNDEA